MVSKLAGLLLLCAGGLLAQRSDTVFVQLGTAINANPATFPIPAGSNIGQPYHILYATFYDKPAGGGCTSPYTGVNSNPPVVDIYGGPSPTVQNVITNYTRIVTPNVSSPTNRFRMVSSAAGAYPFLQVSVGGYNTTACLVNLFYSGSLGSIDIKKYADFGSSTDILQSLGFSVTSSGGATIVPAVCAACRIVVYGLILYNVTAQNITVQDVRSDASTVNLFSLTGFCAGCHIDIPNTNYPLLTTSGGGSLVLNDSTNTAVTGVVLFRIE